MGQRLANLCLKLERQSLDGLIVSSPANITYLTEIPSRDSLLLVSQKENFYFTDSRYIEEVKESLRGCATVKEINGSIFKLIADTCKSKVFKKIAFEERNLSYGEYKSIRKELKNYIKLIPTHGLIEELRQIKEPQEVKKIKKAIQITGQALEFIAKLIAPGKTELELVAELERFIRYKGATNSAFDIIVAAGANSSLPHHISSQRKIKPDEPVLVDMGIEFMGYKSDLTRVFFSDKINGLFRKIYATVLEAQAKAIKLIRPAVKIGEIDAASRKHIAAGGFGKFFGHSLGHGVGIEIHEEPRICAKEKEILLPGMVFTVEPGIYLPGKFGVRIEDMVLVTDEACEVLSGAIHK